MYEVISWQDTAQDHITERFGVLAGSELVCVAVGSTLVPARDMAELICRLLSEHASAPAHRVRRIK